MQIKISQSESGQNYTAVESKNFTTRRRGRDETIRDGTGRGGSRSKRRKRIMMRRRSDLFREEWEPISLYLGVEKM